MTARSTLSRFALAAVLVLPGAVRAHAAGLTEDPVALVPGDAATVAVLHWRELRTSPLAGQVLGQMDALSTEGDAARFLRDTGLTPKDDIDTIVLAMTPGGDSPGGDGLVVFEGRFDPVRIGSALTARGGVLQHSPAGDYYRLAGSSAQEHDGAVAIVNPGLVIAGSESAVAAALGRRESGGAGGLMSGQGLGSQLSRIDHDASAWALVDLARFPKSEAGGGDNGDPSRAVIGAMKSVSLLALQATVHGDSVDVSAFGRTTDAENRGLLEDSLRGVLAMWRMAVQEKSPDLVSVIRRFRVENQDDGVSISGTLPGSFLRSLSAHSQARKDEKD